MTPVPLDPAFFARDAKTVARDLLGKTLCVLPHTPPAPGAPGGPQDPRRRGTRAPDAGQARRCRIVETEAYVGAHDLACHAARGRTTRTDVMYGPAGHAYVYFVYGMHDMLNVVTGAEGDPQAVLVRAAEGLGDLAAQRLDGPGRLTRALGITVGRHNRTALDGPPLWFEDGPPPRRVVATPRIGVAYAGAWAARPLRFVDAASDHLSRPLQRPPPKRAPP